MLQTQPEPGALVTARHTTVTIDGDRFLINGVPTYLGRIWNGVSIEGLLLNSRMVQGTFDDLNPESVARFAYPDTGIWDSERNTREFLAAMPIWRRHGLLGFTVNFQGGSPEGYSKNGTQIWNNSGFNPDGSLRPDFAGRMERIIDFADQLGMVVILGYFYFGQDQRLQDEAAVIRATDEATAWVLDHGWRNVIVEVDNECNVPAYTHEILTDERVHELVERVKAVTRDDRRLYASVSFAKGGVPTEAVVKTADFILMHGNAIEGPTGITEMIRKAREIPGYRNMPVLINEDDHFDFDQPMNHFVAAVREGAGWGYFDYRMKGDGPDDGYQSVPVNWGISSDRKKGFFRLVAEMSGNLSAVETGDVQTP